MAVKHRIDEILDKHDFYFNRSIYEEDDGYFCRNCGLKINDKSDVAKFDEDLYHDTRFRIWERQKDKCKMYGCTLKSMPKHLEWDDVGGPPAMSYCSRCGGWSPKKID